MPDGTRRSKRFSIEKFGARAAKRKAGDWKHELCLAVERGTATDPRDERVTFATWAKDFQLSEKSSLRVTTLARHESTFKNYLVPTFGKRELGNISQQSVQRFVDALVVGGLAAATVRKYYQILHKALEAAVDANMLQRNPCRKIMLPEVINEEMRSLTPKEVAKLAGAIDARYRALVLLGAYGGLRIGELAGLRVPRVDVKAGFVDVREIAVEVRGEVFFGPPKTRRGVRRVPLPKPVAQALKEHIAAYASDAIDDLVFHGPHGGVLRPPAWRRRVWAPAVTVTDLSPLTPHALRHTAVSIWIAAGVSPAEIAARAGHASAAVVLDRYGHLFPQGDGIFRNRVSRLYVPPK